MPKCCDYSGVSFIATCGYYSFPDGSCDYSRPFNYAFRVISPGCSYWLTYYRCDRPIETGHCYFCSDITCPAFAPDHDSYPNHTYGCYPSFPSCCGCDWCCNGDCPTTGQGAKVYPWEVLPEPHTTVCVGTNHDQCPATPQKPNCRYQEFAVGKRPAAHVSPPPGESKGGRHELHSTSPVRAIDYPTGTEECRTYYGHVGKDTAAPASGRHIGWLCGQFNKNETQTKRANRCYPSKRPDGRHSFNCAYRVPCPEKPAVCL
jgi:hypothetical protein